MKIYKKRGFTINKKEKRGGVGEASK